MIFIEKIELKLFCLMNLASGTGGRTPHADSPQSMSWRTRSATTSGCTTTTPTCTTSRCGSGARFNRLMKILVNFPLKGCNKKSWKRSLHTSPFQNLMRIFVSLLNWAPAGATNETTAVSLSTHRRPGRAPSPCRWAMTLRRRRHRRRRTCNYRSRRRRPRR